MNNHKWVNIRVDVEFKARFDAALKKAKIDCGMHISSPKVVIPALVEFCDAVEGGKTKEYFKSK